MKQVINQEIKKFLKEEYNANEGKSVFVQNVRNVFFYNYSTFTSEFDVDIKEYNINIRWMTSIVKNNSFIEKFVVSAEKVEGQFKLLMLDLQTDEVMQESIKDINEFNWKFVVDDETVGLVMNKPLFVKALDFDFKNNTCLVSFNYKA